jgi:hypothetical protein
MTPTVRKKTNSLYIVEVGILGSVPKKLMLKKPAELEQDLEYSKIQGESLSLLEV